MPNRRFANSSSLPSQRSLEAMMRKVTRVRMLDGGVSGNKPIGTEVLLELADTPSITELGDRLAIVEDENTFGHCMCLGDYALLFYAGRRKIATIGLHHGRSIRWDAWKFDALLRDGPRLLTWLAHQGVTAPLQAHELDQRRAEEYRQAAIRWQEAVPACLRPYWDQMQSLADNMVAFVPVSQKGEGHQDQASDPPDELKPLLQALESAYPDPTTRILALFEWYGSGKGPWSGYPSYESLPEQLLLQFPTEQVVTALAGPTLSYRHLEGAARYLAGYYFGTYKAHELERVPQELKQRLLEHCQSSPDTDKVERAKRAFASQVSPS